MPGMVASNMTSGAEDKSAGTELVVAGDDLLKMTTDSTVCLLRTRPSLAEEVSALMSETVIG